MIFVYLGTEEKKLRDKVHVLLESLRKKRPDAELFTLTEENFSYAHIEELSETAGLFEPKHIVFLDHVWGSGLMDEKEAKKILPLMQKAESVFVVLETKVLAAVKKLFETYAEKIVLQDKPERKEYEFNVFALADALVSRDKIKLWSLYLEALRAGKTPEEIHGTLFWQAKSMAQAHQASTAAASGLKPFVYNKARGADKKYSDYEIEYMPWDLIQTLHRARFNSEDLDLVLERWILSI